MMFRYAFYCILVTICFVLVDESKADDVKGAGHLAGHQVGQFAQHGCINCTIDECLRCACREALKTSASEPGHTYVNDPKRKQNDRYLQCLGFSVVCHPCPRGLVWDCQHQTCAKTGHCPDIPEACYRSCHRPLSITTVTTTTVTKTNVTTVIESIRTVTNTTSSTGKTGIISVEMKKSAANFTKRIIALPTTVAVSVTSVAVKGYNVDGVVTTTFTEACNDTSKRVCTRWSIEATPTSTPTAPPTLPPTNQHGCIDCTIDACMRCACREEQRSSGSDHAHSKDPRNEKRFLQCKGASVICQPCPKGLVWDCESNSCAAKGSCPEIPKACWAACGNPPLINVTTIKTREYHSVVTVKKTVVVKNVTDSKAIDGSSSSTTSPEKTLSVESWVNQSTADAWTYFTPGVYSTQPVTESPWACNVSSCKNCDVSTEVVTPPPTTPTTTTTTTTTALPSNQHSCINCTITPLHRCLCAEASRYVNKNSFAVRLCDPVSMGQYLVCKSDEVFCEACPSGTMWNFREQTCSWNRECLPIPAVCRPATGTKTTADTTTVTPAGTFSTPASTQTQQQPQARGFGSEITPTRRCACNSALDNADNLVDDSGSVLICDPHSDRNFLVCQGDEIVVETCARDKKFDGVLRKCGNAVSQPRCPNTPLECLESQEPAFSKVKITLTQRCLCAEALKNSLMSGLGSIRSSIFLCDPHSDDGVLVCRKNDNNNLQVLHYFCSSGEMWNSDFNACSKTRKCLPRPPKCKASDFESTLNILD